MPVSALPEPPAPSPRLAARVHRWAAHRSQHLMAAALAGQGVSFALRDQWLLPALAVMVGAVLLAVWAVAATVAHARGLCAACLAEMPVDAPARAERGRRRLWLFHVTHELPLLTLRAALTLACSVCYPLGVGSRWALALWGAAFVLWMAALTGSVAHRKLVPWCPYCGWNDGGGDDVDADDPDPAIPRRPAA